jgi:hypothetical protein
LKAIAGGILRVRRSHIANPKHVRRPEGKVLKLSNATEVSVGQAYARQLGGILI